MCAYARRRSSLYTREASYRERTPLSAVLPPRATARSTRRTSKVVGARFTLQKSLPPGYLRGEMSFRKSERIIQELRAQILSGQRKPGEKLPTYDELMEMFGVT